MGNDTAVAAAITDLAAAVREHTEHIRMDDQRYWDEKNADVKSDTTEDRVWNPHPDPQQAYRQTVNTMRRFQLQSNDSRRPFPDFVVTFMQSTPHAFRRAPFSGVALAPCRICELPQGNPVHTILLPEFRLED